jgi:hypothetical protein
MTTHPAIVSIRRVLALASVPAADPGRIGAEPGVSVRASDGVLELASLTLDDGTGPSPAELEAAFGAARELPHVWGASYSVLAFDRRGPLGLFAHIDDACGRAVELIVRRY